MKKSIFQKDNLPHGSLREQPEMKRPIWDGHAPTFGEVFDEYKEYLKTLRTIPCSENNWKDGQELEEGKDYELKYFGIRLHESGWEELTKQGYERMEYHAENKDLIKLIAVPIVAQETEDELWFEVWNICSSSQKGKLPKLKSKFTIQRRKQ